MVVWQRVKPWILLFLFILEGCASMFSRSRTLLLHQMQECPGIRLYITVHIYGTVSSLLCTGFQERILVSARN